MREHPAARQPKTIHRLVRTHLESVDMLEHPESDETSKWKREKEKEKESDGKLGELPEFLVYVYKARKYDML